MSCALVKNDKEADAVKQLRKRIEPDGEDVDDMTLLRFLRARNLDLTKAETMIKASMAWRIDYKVDALEFWEHPVAISEGYDVYHCGHDYEGRPVYYAPLGTWASARDLFAKGHGEDCVKFAIKGMHKVYLELMETQNQNFVCIVDIGGLTYRKVAYEIQNLKGIQDLIWLFQNYEANCPETLCKAYVINTPKVFYWGYNIVKPLMSKQTLSKIQIFDVGDKKWKSAIEEFLPANAIPPKLGGYRPVLVLTTQ